jgi:hypothetical protein
MISEDDLHKRFKDKQTYSHCGFGKGYSWDEIFEIASRNAKANGTSYAEELYNIIQLGKL